MVAVAEEEEFRFDDDDGADACGQKAGGEETPVQFFSLPAFTPFQS